ncbi:hypothetical protein [Clostridium celatum]|uniref:hypothetical protein n=1 Tax=Clostridium celatum TaxID=36834 RepID=UPI00058D1F63|nr:hypothetical protein [Clostridium celatum]MCE9654580.1 hypothetical protein [Clostridium celatum]MDU2265176.1 hypothetical protein [Clostridium celatum]MDU3722324.1 hypothetical protein [Clostridium celatum]MDU6295059.1 hypothetical protein [Clostridium celatum]MDY3359552.1 hypothetical protein [Clostridium celatum]
MNKFINRFLNIVLIMLITFLVLNQFYIIQFSDSIRDVFIFLTLTLILLTSSKELLTGSSRISKALSILILACAIIGGIYTVADKQLNILIYFCLFFSLLQGFLDLVHSNA